MADRADATDGADAIGASVEGYPFRFSCRRSGNCCSIPGGFVRVTDAEAAAIAAHLNLSVEGFKTRYLDGTGSRLVEGPGHGCVFLAPGRESSCSIYPVRPQRCQTWPFWPELQGNLEAVHRAAKMCPGIEPQDGVSDHRRSLDRPSG